MKKLYIVRHSKAVEYAEDNSDFNRCLADYGVEKATLISRHLSQKLEQVDLILSSPACRAYETAKIFATALNYDESEIILKEPLYHFGGIERAMQIIAAVDQNVNTLMLFGHNPTFNALAWHLCDKFRDAMPTSAVVGIEFKVKSWSQIVGKRGSILHYLTKKNLK
ncbi:MAG: histidine phosphatase family protein [Candidatus Marinimicrobia bacterium]|nr:histidine phosphatase family protein [Candidatus Neomarinimicrobiota bacterium]